MVPFPDILETLIEALRTAVLVSGLVVIMMMLIESFNVESRGRAFAPLRRSGFLQVISSALLGSIPGCVGGFAVVSLYTHRMLSFGALLAMMIASVGDESFMMLAMFPGKAVLLFAGLFVLGVCTGLVVDRLSNGQKRVPTRLEDTYDLHDEDGHHHDPVPQEGKQVRRYGWKRMVMLLGVALFLAALLSGWLEEDEGAPLSGFNLLGEKWIFWIFGALSLVVLGELIFASDHFIQEHLWEHIIRRHLPSIFGWTFGVLLAVGLLFRFVDLEAWIGGNTSIMVLLAIAVGLIPESGPHLAFVTLYAGGVIPFDVLLANSIVQDGHASLPLIADSKKAFVKAKAFKVGIALVVFLVRGLLL